MAIDFPGTPTQGDTHTEAGITWEFDGSKWVPRLDLVLADISDIDLSSNTQGATLVYNETENKWQATTSGGTGGSYALTVAFGF